MPDDPSFPQFDSFESLLAVAMAVRDLSTGWDAEERIAFAWTLKNRLAARAGQGEREDGRGALACTASTFATDEADAIFADNSLAAALELVAAIWLGEVPDPTGGATACHRHDILPSWAKFKSVKALIGQQLFYG
jgi:hypothetical protein